MAFDRTCEIELLPMKRGEDCEARKILDEAAADAIGVGPDVVADWRLAAGSGAHGIQPAGGTGRGGVMVLRICAKGGADSRSPGPSGDTF